MNEYNEVGLYEHNVVGYEKVKEGYETSNVVGVVRATGTGKTYIGMQLVYDNKDLKTLWVIPSLSIKEHIKETIKTNPSLNMKRDFSNLTFRTYQNLIYMDYEELASLDIDLLILDEFHHIGAPVWGEAIDIILSTHPGIKVFGMTAYSVRDRGNSYERDMTLDEGDELFSNHIVSRYDICDAMLDGILPKPIYKCSKIKLLDMSVELETRIQKLEESGRICTEYKKVLADVKRRIHEAPNIEDIIKQNIRKNGKYIYFCPPSSEKGVNDIETIKEEAMEWFKQIVSEENIVFYTSLSEMEDSGKSNRDAFYNDLDLNGNKVNNKLRVMFAINQYNEGVHAPGINGVIMGRYTRSDIVFFEEVGRALHVCTSDKNEKDAYKNLSIDVLRSICSYRNIDYTSDMTKDELFELLVSPVIIDLAGNLDYIKELEDNLRFRNRERRIREYESDNDKILSKSLFGLDLEEVKLFEILGNLTEKVKMTWFDWYNLASKYFMEHGDLEIPDSYKTADGEALGRWISNQRRAYHNGKLSSEKIELLKKINMNFERKIVKLPWIEMFKIAEKYYLEHNNTLNVPYDYKVDGISLGTWLGCQRLKYKNGKLDQEKIDLLNSIGMSWDVRLDKWNLMYEEAKKYYLKYGNLNIGKDSGELGVWIIQQRVAYKSRNLPPEKRSMPPLSDERVQKLEEIGMIWNVNDSNWDKMYEKAKAYYLEHNHLRIIIDNSDLGRWIDGQRRSYREGTISEVHKRLLDEIGMIWNVHDEKWNLMYEKTREFFEENGHLNAPKNYKVIGIDGKPIGLRRWIDYQKELYSTGDLSEDKILRLESIGIIWNSKKNVSDIINLCNDNNIDVNKNKKIISHISLAEFKVKLAFARSKRLKIVNSKGELHKIFSMSSMNMKLEYGKSLEDLINLYGKEKKK